MLGQGLSHFSSSEVHFGESFLTEAHFLFPETDLTEFIVPARFFRREDRHGSDSGSGSSGPIRTEGFILDIASAKNNKWLRHTGLDTFSL